MLVLSRRVGESIEIGNNVTVKVVRINGDKIRIGIEAPPEINIRRSELADENDDGAKETNGEETGRAEAA